MKQQQSQLFLKDDETGWWEDEEDGGASRLPAVTLKFLVCSLHRDSRRLSRRKKLQ